jgi:hypothetical protein
MCVVDADSIPSPLRNPSNAFSSCVDADSIPSPHQLRNPSKAFSIGGLLLVGLEKIFQPIHCLA